MVLAIACAVTLVACNRDNDKDDHEHTFGEWTMETQPTCTADGKEVRTCSDCSATEEKSVPALGHSEIGYEAKLPTCTEDGYDAYVICSRCDYTTKNVKSKLGHDIVSYDAKAPGCTEDGHNAYEECSRCGNNNYQKIDAVGHKLVQHDAKEPTCDEVGNFAYVTCENCDHTTYREIPAQHKFVDGECTECGEEECEVHTYGDWYGNTATCTETGKEYKKCSVCGHVISQDTNKLPHVIVTHDAKAPTCTENGWETYETCKNCVHTTYKELPAAHTVKQVEAKAPTCTENGWEAYEYCTACDSYTTYKEIEAPGHDKVYHDAKAPSCTEVGNNAYETCKNCEYTTYKEIPTKHDFVNGKCSICGEECSEHKYGDWYGNTATCKEGGEEYRTCDSCGHSETRATSKTSHKYENKICIWCGKKDYTLPVQPLSNDEE